jgi:hypothetical protein
MTRTKKVEQSSTFEVAAAGLVYSVTVTLEEITPKRASDYLRHNFDCNRKRSKVRVRRYKNVMARHKWMVTHEGIAFDDQGRLFDGQHRLEGVVESGESVWMFVFRGLPEEVYFALGRPMLRRIDDVATEAWITSRVVAVGRVMLLGVRAGSGIEVAGLDEDALLTAIRQHERAIQFVLSRHHNHMVTAPVLGACCRAYYSADSERLAAFLHVVQTNDPSDAGKDHAALMMYRYISSEGRGSNSYKARADLYKRTEFALSHFLQGRRIEGKLVPAARELFPLPEQEENT